MKRKACGGENKNLNSKKYVKIYEGMALKCFVRDKGRRVNEKKNKYKSVCVCM